MTHVAGEDQETAARSDLTCPVIHLDVSPPMTAGSYWQKADELREHSPAFFNAVGQGYWIFTRYEQVRDMYQHPEIFSSESITPGNRIPPTGSCPPRSTRPSTAS